MCEAVVEYDYVAQEPDELTIRKGDVIREIVKKTGGWWEGTLREKRGMFPDNFVSVIQKESKVTLRTKNNKIRQCRAIFSYHPAHDDELSLSVGDIIDVLGEVEEGWWKGRLGANEGVFPSNFVAEIEQGKSHSKSNSKEDLTSLAGETDSGVPHLPPKPSKIICQVKYPYDACNEDELTLREGDLIVLISKDGQDRGWWRGELKGKIGVFPDNFVVVIPSSDQNGPYPKEKKAERTSKLSTSPNITNDDGTSKPTNVAAQRKSLEIKNKEEDHRVPPVPGKKPSVPKKSPSSVSSSGALAGLKQRLSDMVDGAVGSKSNSQSVKQDDAENDFDQVERSSMLSDMRANRAKAPGRRPPSTVYRETEPGSPGLMNGNAEHIPEQKLSLSENSNDEDESDKKPKVREWEKHKAPWVEELKLNQAKRTPPLTPGSCDRLKLTPTNDKSVSPSENETSDIKAKTQDMDISPVEMTRSMSALSTKSKTPSNDSLQENKSPNANVALRTKTSQSPAMTTTPMRPQTIHGGSGGGSGGSGGGSGGIATNLSTNIACSQSQSQSPSPGAKPPVADKGNIASSPRTSVDRKVETVSLKQYLDLLERISLVESKMQQRFLDLQTTIEELKGKLQVETDMRRLLQAELERVAQCVTQV